MTSSTMWRWLLGLDAIPAGSEGVGWSWQYPMPGWAWLLIVVGAAAISYWSYRQMVGARSTRTFLAVVRWMLLTLTAVLIAGPMLRLAVVETQPDWVVLLTDRSRSMLVSDSHTGDSGFESRDVVAMRLLSDPVWDEIQKSKQLVSLGFHTSTFDLDPKSPTPAQGWSTDLNVPIESAMGKLAGRPASAIIIVSDGRTVAPVDRSVIRALLARAIPIFVVPVGSPKAMSDLSVVEAEAPQRAFVRDQVPVVARIECSGGAPVTDTTVELIDAETGRTINSVDVTPTEFVQQHGEVVLTGVRPDAGPVKWIVRVAAGADDLVRANDEQSVEVDFVDRPLRILYIEGYPRWEYRYLKNLLVREKSFESSVMLLSADRDFAQEGNTPLERLPQTEEEFNQYDLFIIGDVPSGSLSDTQVSGISKAVSERGAGLLWIAGEHSTPTSWRGTPLDDLLPIRSNPERFDEAVIVEPTDGALRAGVMRMGETTQDRWPAALSSGADRAQLEWAQRIEAESLKPAAETLASASAISGGPASPIVMSMRFGAGIVLYVATDETWRWRHGIGETYQERFWIQFIRYLSRGAVQRDGRPFALAVEPKQLEVGTPAMIRVDVQDPKAGETAGDAPLEVQIDPIGSSSQAAPQSIQLTRERDGWVGTWTPESQGVWRVHVDSSRTGPMEQTVQVRQTDSELLHPETDHPQLSELATRTGGAVVKVGELDRLIDLLPKRALTKEQSIVDPLWNSPAALIAVITLFLVEWMGRRWLRLA